jgi:predicted transcriptional regulator
MELIDSTLRSVRSGATKTQIMCRAVISHAQLKEFLILLEEKELIKYEEGSRVYWITDKGLRFVEAYNKISELIPNTRGRNSIERGKMTPLLSSERIEVYNS